jgi:hypothetical protein
MTKPTPDWSIPENLAELLDADEDGIWSREELAALVQSVLAAPWHGAYYFSHTPRRRKDTIHALG